VRKIIENKKIKGSISKDRGPVARVQVQQFNYSTEAKLSAEAFTKIHK